MLSPESTSVSSLFLTVITVVYFRLSIIARSVENRLFISTSSVLKELTLSPSQFRACDTGMRHVFMLPYLFIYKWLVSEPCLITKYTFLCAPVGSQKKFQNLLRFQVLISPHRHRLCFF